MTDTNAAPTAAPEIKTEPNPSIPSDNVTAAGANEAPAEAPPSFAFPHTFKTKVNGKEREITVKNVEEMQRLIQLREASDERFKEASEMRKLSEQLFQLLKTNPKEALTHPLVSHDLLAMAEEILQEHLQNQLADPKDKEIRRLQKELEARERKTKEAEELSAKEKAKVQEEEQFKVYQKLLDEALKLSGVPRTKYAVDRVIGYLDEAISMGADRTAEEISEYLRGSYEADYKPLFGSLPTEKLVALLGPDTIKRLREFEVAKIKSPETIAPVPASQPEAKDEARGPKGKKLQDVFDAVRKSLKE